MKDIDNVAAQVFAALIGRNGTANFRNDVVEAYKCAKYFVEQIPHVEVMGVEWMSEEQKRWESELINCSDLTNFSVNGLLFNGLYSLEEVSKFTEKELKKLPHIGPKTVEDVKIALQKRGMSLKVLLG